MIYAAIWRVAPGSTVVAGNNLNYRSIRDEGNHEYRVQSTTLPQGSPDAYAIEELNFDDLDHVNGGIPLAVPVFFAIYGKSLAWGAGFASGAALLTAAYVKHN